MFVSKNTNNLAKDPKQVFRQFAWNLAGTLSSSAKNRAPNRARNSNNKPAKSKKRTSKK